MIYANSTRYKETFASVFSFFTTNPGINGDPKRLADKLYAKYTVDDFAYHDDFMFSGVQDYFRTVVIPHKIAVYEAGICLHDAYWFKQLNVDGEQFIENLWLHDLSKFSAAEAIGYAMHDFKNPNPKTKPAFERAWHHHKMNNPHHPEYWTNPNRSGGSELIPMPMICILEMVADWIGAGKTYGSTLAQWLPNNLHKFLLHPETLKNLQVILSRIGINTEIEGECLVYNEKHNPGL